MHSFNKTTRVISGMLLLAAFTMFYCVQHDGDDNVLDWVDFDTIPPVITLLGDNPYSIELDSSYIEWGATAYDSVDGDLTVFIVTDASAVDTSTIGTYQVVYTVSDYAGNEAVENRTVHVAKEKVDTASQFITLLGPNPFPLID